MNGLRVDGFQTPGLLILTTRDAVRFAVGDIEQPRAIDEETVRARQFARERRGPGPSSDRPEDRRDDAVPDIDPPDDVCLGIRPRRGPVAWCVGQPWDRPAPPQGLARHRRNICLPVPATWCNASSRIDAVDGAALPQGEIQASIRCEGKRPRPVERRACERCAVGVGWATRARVGRDRPRRQIH